MVSGTTPYHTFLELLSPRDRAGLPTAFNAHIANVDYSCGGAFGRFADSLSSSHCKAPGTAHPAACFSPRCWTVTVVYIGSILKVSCDAAVFIFDGS